MKTQSLLVCLLAAILVMSASLQAKQLEFSLYDSNGYKVSSQDYAGVPIFLEFGACW
ncbi:MAG: hypothetical protein ACYSUT_07115 [Planctomycetota bacterium]|jgi:hypothetical protein